VIDLRSDTVTKPTLGMRAAMAAAEVGDDVYGEDPTVRRLEEQVAALLGKPAALFTPTGSMANLLAIRSLVKPGEEVLCDAQAHIARAELGAHGAINGVTMRTWTHPQGMPEVGLIEAIFAQRLSPYFVSTAAISIENTHNFAGGTVISLPAMREVAAFASAQGVGVHLDGARLWNAHIATTTPLHLYAELADVVCVCLSKGLGAPVGSLVAGPADMIAEARVWRKRLGGGMRQVGVLAAAGLYALDHQLERLADDHAHAELIAHACEASMPETNIVVLTVNDAPSFVGAAADGGVQVGALGQHLVRVVTHLDVDTAAAQRAAAILGQLVRADRTG
jgi:threonine aldolase